MIKYSHLPCTTRSLHGVLSDLVVSATFLHALRRHDIISRSTPPPVTQQHCTIRPYKSQITIEVRLIVGWVLIKIILNMKLLVVSTLCILVTVCLAQDAFNRDGLRAHNAYRARHGAAPLTYSAKLHVAAQKWANYLANANAGLRHSTGTGYGENIAWKSGRDMSASRATTMWYNEVSNYNFTTGKSNNRKPIGHFTQVVWKGSKEMAIAKARGKGGIYVVANYNPPGNYVRQNLHQVGRA